MKARLWRLLSDLHDAFWLVPMALGTTAIALALALLELDRRELVPEWLVASNWLYSGGGTGARTLLGAVASSTIGVAGTAFSITIASLSLAAGQMGPRLLTNFTRDRGNQITLGAFLGTFCYSLMVLRAVRTEGEGTFTPHLALSVAILLAFVCVVMLVYFVGHMAARLNVDTVVELVSRDVRVAVDRLTTHELFTPPPRPIDGDPTTLLVTDPRRGYLEQLDEEGLADWAEAHGTVLHLLVRTGDYVFPGAPIALVNPAVEGVDAAIKSATALGPSRTSTADLEYSIRQLVEVAARALSPGINDPHTAISVIDRLGATLCDVARATLPNGVIARSGRAVLVRPAIDYDGLLDSMFHLVRQNAAGTPAVLIRMLEILSAVATCERCPARLGALARHADLVQGDGERTIATPGDVADLRRRHDAFTAARRSSDRRGRSVADPRDCLLE